ncbi:PREDICTED: antigen WC1.1-like [Branchiostoma belcheri]|uniref:Soluble scavenger receptor cysteine-rich domain-containing protein SSC5D n=1 Tax=Branchiostoma belcheri TaxID=7741 RepID=A0A6P4ZTC5_BRABE|nr:PREDICTED: antigen WC1.1-like [Branchiostoma belcheri]
MVGGWQVVLLLTVLRGTGAQVPAGYEGCYVDQAVRNFPHEEKWDGQLTNARCVSHCRDKGYPYAATEFTFQCFCGTDAQFNTLPAAVPDWECSTDCTGNSGEKCGGPWRMSVYAVVALKNEIRLVGGGKEEEGRVEVRAYNTKDWGTVCSTGFDMDDARVACNMLGLGDPEFVRDTSYFGQGTGAIKMANLDCGGHESSLFDCSYNGPGSHSCSHGEDVGIVCGGVLSAGAIVGIVFGVLIFLVIVLTVTIICCQKNKTPGRVLGPAPPAGGAPTVVTSNVMYPAAGNATYIQQGVAYPMQSMQPVQPVQPVLYAQPNQPPAQFTPVPQAYDQAAKPPAV